MIGPDNTFHLPYWQKAVQAYQGIFVGIELDGGPMSPLLPKADIDAYDWDVR